MTHGNPYDGLSSEAKARLKGCETPEEMHELAKEEGYELSDEELDGIAGGWCDEHEWGCPADKCGVYGIGR